jgi:hypothetical protein
MRVFLAGIIQGSYKGLELHDQSYRDRLKAIFRAHLPDAETCCPIEMHPAGVGYAPEQQRLAFFELVETASQADLLVAYLPEASLGTAIEMWEAYHHGRPVVVITPMRENWVINLTARAVFPTLDAFEAFVRDGGLENLISPPSGARGIPRRTLRRRGEQPVMNGGLSPSFADPAAPPAVPNGLPSSLEGKGGRGG